MKHSNVNKDIKTGMNSRRQFITKAAAGGVVAALASKTAWAGGSSATGCSVSGNLSGNLSQARDCSTANVKGESPYVWKRFSMAIDPSPPRKLLVISNGKMCLAWADLLLASQEKVTKLSETF